MCVTLKWLQTRWYWVFDGSGTYCYLLNWSTITYLEQDHKKKCLELIKADWIEEVWLDRVDAPTI